MAERLFFRTEARMLVMREQVAHCRSILETEGQMGELERGLATLAQMFELFHSELEYASKRAEDLAATAGHNG